jgi:glycogen debranching enzyme
MTGLFEASRFVDVHRLPELFCGFHRRPGEGPTLYPVACAPQAWATGETRYSQLKQINPQEADNLLALNKEEAQRRYAMYKRYAAMDYSK